MHNGIASVLCKIYSLRYCIAIVKYVNILVSAFQVLMTVWLHFLCFLSQAEQ